MSATERAYAIARFERKVDEARAQGAITFDLKQLESVLAVLKAAHRVLEHNNVHALEALHQAFEGFPS